MLDTKKINKAEILKTLQTFHKEGDVIEVRILNTSKSTVSGYFEDFNTLVESIRKFWGQYDIYFTLNPVNKDLLARCKNRLETYAKKTSTDNDMVRINWILIDLDPVRTSGISATDGEKEEAHKLANKIKEYLMEEGFTAPIFCDSGNGYHLLVSVDLKNSQENTKVVKKFLAALDFLYSTDKVHVDTMTFNPSRIVKLYGTKSCKGDDVEERPHRFSKILEIPEEIRTTKLDIIKKVADKLPEVKNFHKTKKVGRENSLDVDELIQKHGLDLAYSAPYLSNATKFIFKTCFWRKEHKDNAAYIIKFEDGGIAAGCHHNSCQGENWQTLKVKLGIQEQAEEEIGGGEEKQSDVILQLVEGVEYFTDDMGGTFIAAPINGHTEVISLDPKSKQIKLYLTKLFYECKKTAPRAESLKEALAVMNAKSIYEGEEIALSRRIVRQEGNIYYDLCNTDWSVVKISVQGVCLEKNPPILFTRGRNMKEQLLPADTAQPEDLMELVKKHFRFKSETDQILFTVYLVSCFLPEIAHVVLVMFGEKGAAKSTSMRMIKKIVDPAREDLLTLPSSKQDLAIILANNYMPCFDNLDGITPAISDLLCMGSTGGSFSKRTLYTDADETILSFKRCIVLNGINVAASRPDLLDRSIVLELERISTNERKTEKAIWEAFDNDIPMFLGASFKTISDATHLYDDSKIDTVGRMADFTIWGYAIAEVLGIGGETFIEAYLQNQTRANEEVLASNPVASAVIKKMQNNRTWSDSVSQLLKELELTAEKEHINTKVKLWPKEPNILTKRLKEIKSNLEEVGIFYGIRNVGTHKEITLENKTLTSKKKKRNIESGEKLLNLMDLDL
jgi:hypothetical protein